MTTAYSEPDPTIARLNMMDMVKEAALQEALETGEGQVVSEGISGKEGMYTKGDGSQVMVMASAAAEDKDEREGQPIPEPFIPKDDDLASLYHWIYEEYPNFNWGWILKTMAVKYGEWARVSRKQIQRSIHGGLKSRETNRKIGIVWIWNALWYMHHSEDPLVVFANEHNEPLQALDKGYNISQLDISLTSKGRRLALELASQNKKKGISERVKRVSVGDTPPLKRKREDWETQEKYRDLDLSQDDMQSAEALLDSHIPKQLGPEDLKQWLHTAHALVEIVDDQEKKLTLLQETVTYQQTIIAKKDEEIAKLRLEQEQFSHMMSQGQTQ